MPMPKRADHATAADCSWDFLTDGGWMREIRTAARMAARDYRVEEGDLLQELIIHYAVRPRVTKRRPGRGYALKEAMRLARSMKNKRGLEIGYEDAGIE